jgi:ferredoxin
MKQEKNSEKLSEYSPEASDIPPGSSAEILSEKHLADFRHIDFHSPEFNAVDDLDDNIGNFRDFQALDGIVTADMLHQEERKKKQDSPGKNDKSLAAVKHSPERNISKTQSEPEPSPLIIVSKGRTLIIGTDGDSVLYCGELLTARGLSCSLYLVTDKEDDRLRPCDNKQSFMHADSIIVNGSFGGFTAEITCSSGQVHTKQSPVENNSAFDLVLDLQSVPAFAGKRLPMGYYAPGGDKARLEAALRELSELKGRFTKPQFTVFHKESCLYGLSRANNCQRCLEICPVSAIRIEHEEIFINQHLCQGCGSCALVCPSDAIHMINPSGNELAAGIRDLLTASRDDISSPVLVIHPEDIPPVELNKISDNFDNRPVLFGVDEVACIGPEIMLAALAYGAGAVVMVLNGDIPADTIRALERRQQVCAAVLRGLEIQEDRISLFVLPAGMSDFPDNILYPALHEANFSAPMMPAATFSPDCDRRTLFRLAVRHLYDVSAGDSPWITLPADAPFGAIALDKSACTLCMACASVCPTGALSAGNDHPLLCFVENNCHQCGLCSEACPEGAVQLFPRISCDDDTHQPPAVLHEAEPFNCIECGVPFAAAAMIKHLEDKLAGHWMYSSDRQIRRLRMCRTCRTRDALLAKDFQR